MEALRNHYHKKELISALSRPEEASKAREELIERVGSATLQKTRRKRKISATDRCLHEQKLGKSGRHLTENVSWSSVFLTIMETLRKLRRIEELRDAASKPQTPASARQICEELRDDIDGNKFIGEAIRSALVMGNFTQAELYSEYYEFNKGKSVLCGLNDKATEWIATKCCQPELKVIIKDALEQGRYDLADRLINRLPISSGQWPGIPVDISMQDPEKAIKLIEKVSKYGCDVSVYVLAGAAKTGQKDIVKAVERLLDVDLSENRVITYTVVEKAIESGNQELVKWITKKTKTSVRHVINEDGCEIDMGQLNSEQVTQLLSMIDTPCRHKRFKPLDLACKKGRVDIIRAIQEKFKYTADEIFRTELPKYLHTSRDLAEWAFNEFKPQNSAKELTNVILNALSGGLGQAEQMLELVLKNNPTVINNLRVSIFESPEEWAYRLDKESIKWVVDKFGHGRIEKHILEELLIAATYSAAVWLVEYYKPIVDRLNAKKIYKMVMLPRLSAPYNNVETLELLYTSGLRPAEPEKLLKDAHQTADPWALEWFAERFNLQRAPLTETSLRVALDRGCPRYARWLLKDEQKVDNKLLCLAARKDSRQFVIADLLAARYEQLTGAEQAEQYRKFRSACKRRDVQAVKDIAKEIAKI